MQATERPSVDLQKQFWTYWNFKLGLGHPSDYGLRPLRRGEKILAYLRSLHLTRPTILDLGCGTGWFAKELAQLGPTTGIDLCDEAIAQAKGEVPEATFRAGNLFEMDLPARSFDVVVSQEVIAHVADQSGYLERVARVLKPGGYLILTTPNLFVHKRNNWGPIPPGHIEQWVSQKTLRRLLRPHFHVLRVTTAVPIGHGGILRLVNSTKLNWVLGLLFSPRRIEAFKEWAGFGWTRIVLAQRSA